MLTTINPSKQPKLKAVPMLPEEREAVKRVLDAAGEVLVTRTMTKVCRPKYDNNGWSNCFFIQMFGGKANFNRMQNAESVKAGYTLNEEGAIARRLGVDKDDVETLIHVFDHNGVEEAWEYDEVLGYEIEKEKRVSLGKVTSLLVYVDKWLAKRGIVLNWTWEPKPKKNIDTVTA